MALSIKSDEADRLARELAAATGESLTEAVVVALRQHLARQRDVREANMLVRVRRLQDEVAALPVLDDRPADMILGYDEDGMRRSGLSPHGAVSVRAVTRRP